MTTPNQDQPGLLSNSLAQHAPVDFDPGAPKNYSSPDTITGIQSYANRSGLAGISAPVRYGDLFGAYAAANRPDYGPSGATGKTYMGQGALEDSGLHPGVNQARKVDPNVQARINQVFAMGDSDELPPF